MRLWEASRTTSSTTACSCTESAVRSVVIGTLAEILTACSVSVIVIVFDKSSTRRAKSVGCVNLTAWCSGPRGCTLTRDVLLLDAVRLCAGVPVRSTVRRDGDEVWGEDG
ncbi:unnamed protein product [Prunus brigantina]